MDRLGWVLLSVTVPESSKTESMKERQTEDMQKWQAAGTCVAVSYHWWFWSYIFLFLFVLWNEGVMLQWKHTCRVAKLHTHICMHAQRCLICKGKLGVTRAVPAADCCHASLGFLLWVQTMTTQPREAPEHQNEVSSELEVSQPWCFIKTRCYGAHCIFIFYYLIWYGKYESVKTQWDAISSE